MELDKKAIGNRINIERKNIGLTQEELAIKLGLNNKSSVSQYEKGDTLPGDDIKVQMCNLFNCSLDYLLCKSDVRNSENKVDFDADKLRIGLSTKDYENITDTQIKQIEELAKVILKDNLKDKDKK